MNLPKLKTLPTQEEVDALRVQVEALREVINHYKKGLVPSDNAMDELAVRVAATPVRCLAEIKAQGIMEALDYAKEKCSTYLDVDFYVMEYANLLTDADKGGEQ